MNLSEDFIDSGHKSNTRFVVNEVINCLMELLFESTPLFIRI